MAGVKWLNNPNIIIMKIKKYFGLEIPETVPEKLRMTLAKFLFISTTSIPEINETLHLGLEHKVTRKLISNLRKEAGILLKDPNRMGKLRNRLMEWQIECGTVNESELYLVEEELFLPKRSLTTWLQNDIKNIRAIDIVTFLQRSVICQDDAIRKISLSAYNHIKNSISEDVDTLIKAHCLIGHSGSGKSLVLKKLKEFFEANKFDVALISAANLVRPGIVGLTIEDIFTNLYVASSNHTDAIQTAVIMLDEFDKLRLNDGDSDSRKIQNQLLQFFEAGNFTFPSTTQQYSDQHITIDTNRILFVLSGAFLGINDIIGRRLKSTYGDKTKYMKTSRILNSIEKEDLVTYGIIPELASRIAPIPFNKLTQNDFRTILLQSEESPLKMHQQKLLREYNIVLEMEDEAIDILVAHSDSMRDIEPKLSCLISHVYLNPIHDTKVIINAETLRSSLWAVSFLYEQLFEDFADSAKVPDFTRLAKKYMSPVDEILDLYNLYKTQTT